MKQLILVFTLFIAIMSVSFAQNTQSGQQAKTPQQKAQHQAKKWTKQLSLNATQTSQLETIFLQQTQQVDAIKAKYASAADKKAERTEIKAVHTQTEESLKKTLTSEQYNQYIAIKTEKKQAHHKESGTPKQ